MLVVRGAQWVKAIQTGSPDRRSALMGNPSRSESDCAILCGQHIRSNFMSEITRVYKLGAITGSALIAAAAVVAVLGTAVGA